MAERYRTATRTKAAPTGRAGAARKPSSRPLTLEEKREKQRRERERARRMREERARIAAARREARKRLFRLCLVVSLVFVVIYWTFVGVSILNRDDSADETLPLLLFTDGERKEDKRFEPESISRGGVSYLPVSFLDQYMAISQFGDHATRSFLLCDGGEYATFYLGSEEAIVNGVRVSLQDPAVMENGQLYLPVSFFAEKMTCFTLTEAVAAYGADVLTFYSDAEGFRFNLMPVSGSVDYATVPVAPTVPAEV